MVFGIGGFRRRCLVAIDGLDVDVLYKVDYVLVRDTQVRWTAVVFLICWPLV